MSASLSGRSSLFTRGKQFDDPPLGAFDSLHLEARLVEEVDWVAQEVISLEANGVRIQKPLHRADGQRRAAHMLEQEQQAALAFANASMVRVLITRERLVPTDDPA